MFATRIFIYEIQRWQLKPGIVSKIVSGVPLTVNLSKGLYQSYVRNRDGGYRRRREWGGPALFPWLTGLAILLVPVMTADFSLRYVVPAVPAVSIAAALLFLRPVPQPATSRVPPPTTSAGAGRPAPDQRSTDGPLPA